LKEKIQRIETGYKPRKYQAILHPKLKRGNVLVCHRGFGKTVFAINHIIDDALRCENKDPLFAYVAPTYGQAKRIAWETLKNYTKMIPGVESNEADLRLDIPRPNKKDKARVMLLGAEKPDSIRGVHLDGAILDEFSEMDPVVWTEVINPALRIKQGWVIFIGTPKGMNHFYDVLQTAKQNTERWFNVVYRASETEIIPEEELEASRAIMTEEQYLQEFECSFSAALIGSYYAKEIEWLQQNNRVTTVDHDPSVPVDTFWDLGISDTTCVWFLQQVGKENHIIDYFEQSGVGLDYYVKMLREKPYIYRDHVFPHDASARELGTGRSREETLRKLGLRITILPRHNVADGISSVRLMLKSCWFDAVKTEKGFHALRSYERKWNSKMKRFDDKPKHNWASNASDAFRILGMGIKPESTRRSQASLPRVCDNQYDIWAG